MPLTSEEYAAKGGNECPNCGSGYLTGEGVEIDIDKAWQAVTCLSCKAKWVDEYRLTGYQTTSDGS